MNIPQIIKQVWSSIKSFAQSIAKLFGGLTEEEKVQKDLRRDLGGEISKGFKQQFRELTEIISSPQGSLVGARI